MGILLLIIVLLFEVGLSVYSVITKSKQVKIKSWMRVSSFVVFVILTLTSIIVWSFRWILPGLLLFILAVKATITLLRLRNKSQELQPKTTKVILKTITITLTMVIALLPAIVFPQHKSPKVTGQYKVSNATYTYVDEKRIETFSEKEQNRFVNVKYWYPEDTNETYPLLVFSHGATGINSSNSSTFTELASHGYIVASIDHPYHSFYTKSNDGEVVLINSDYNREVSNANTDGIYSKKEVFKIIQKWMKLRTEDISFVIDTIVNNTAINNDPIYQQINTEKIAVFGHSMGGAASVWLGRERSDIDAVVNIDAPYFSEIDYNDDIDDFVTRENDYTTPILNIYSDDVWKQLDSSGLYAANKLDNAHFKDAITVYFQGAKHLSLTDLPLVSPLLANLLQGGSATIDPYYCIETENELILQFFDDVLKGKGQFNPQQTY